MRFDQPVGSQAARDAPTAWREWAEIVKFAQLYTVPATGAQAYHPGSDLSNGLYDFGLPVYASSDGKVMRVLTERWAGIIIIEHVLEDGSKMWTRSAHVKPTVEVGQVVKRGQQIATINDYYPPGASNDHLHFDIAKKNLALTPDDWPGMDLERLKRDYVDPRLWINTHREDEVARLSYEKVVHAVRPSATQAQWDAVSDSVYEAKQSLMWSVHDSFSDTWLKDDAGLWYTASKSRKVILWGYTEADAASLKTHFETIAPGSPITVEVRAHPAAGRPPEAVVAFSVEPDNVTI